MRIILTIVMLLVFGSHAHAQGRSALVVGIDNYAHISSLQKAVNDANAVSAALDRLGFRVTTLIDADRRTLNQGISRFSAAVQPGDEVVFFFAGHGIEVASRNYILPADVPAARPGDEEFIVGESIAVDRLLGAFQGQGARVTVLIIDACRTNPFPTRGERSLGGARGLARMDPPEGAFILFSAGTGQSALDRLSNEDRNPNSVFTRALLPRLQEPGKSIHDLVREVRNDVRELAASVRHDQFPAYYDQLIGVFSFNLGTPKVPAEHQPEGSMALQGAAIEAPMAAPCEEARADWQVLAATQSPAALEAFIREHPLCPIYVEAARDRLTSLETTINRPTATLPNVAVIPLAGGGDLCSRLWYDRNLIFHNKGYCFSTARARTAFDTSRCTTRTPVLTRAEAAEVARIQAAEQANGC